ncbi:MAG: Rne/Rng family ribonuclease [Cyclobacteriaceae bacterium]|nr:Rne/Rng family ribonuclease [Cyclobacteriaceae bacterium]MCH8517371.1 Rne/Rng family ribonuclease [Cyclobacteriaceae bacterium]
MSNQLIINATESGCRIALLKDRGVSEYHIEEDNNQFTVGDIYLGRVSKVDQGLNASFIDIGYEKDAFLHYLDLGPQIKSLQKFVRVVQNSKQTSGLSDFKMEKDINKLGKINQVLSRNQQVLVQVVKEPISTKGPRLSCELSIAGRYLILVPFSSAVSISKRISNADERKRLQRLLTSIKPANFGVIIRTAAENKSVADLDKDLRSLIEKWDKGIKKLQNAKPREKVIGEISRASSMLRDMLNESFESIVTDDEIIYDEVKQYIKTIAPDKEKIVKHYSGKVPLFENLGIEKQLKSLFGKSVSLPGGGYLIIEHTEALHVIDVNSGNKSNIEKDQENTALHVNINAAKEIARQLRLRDMGGIIVVDFIDMKKAENKKLLYTTMKEEMKSERSKYTILPLTKFGLMQITRQRVRPEMNIKTQETCPTCNGTGKINASIMLSDEVESNLNYLVTKQNEKDIKVKLHPYLYAYFTNGFPSIRMNWLFKYGKWIKLQKDSSLPLTTFKFVRNNDEEINLKA